MSEKTRKTRVVLPLLAAGLILPAAGSMPEPLTGGTAGELPEAREAAALYQLGVMRMNGEGGAQDIAAGRYWIHLAARHGYPLAQYNLGVMYFDGIGGEYNRLCAQWWLTRAAEQDDPEVHQMAAQALQSAQPEMSALPKVYRPVSAAECDRLPMWQRESAPVTESPELPVGDIDTEKMVIIQEPPVTKQAAVPEEHAPEPPEPESAAAETETESVKEMSEPAQTSSAEESTVLPGQGTEVSGTESVTATKNAEQDGNAPPVPEGGNDTETASEDVPAVTLQDDTGNAGHGQGNEGGSGNAGTSVPVITAPVPDSTVQLPKTAREQEGRPAEADEHVRVLKPKAVRAAPVLNLGGSPATAPGKHYTLQLSGGTTPGELYRTARRHKLGNYVVYETERHGQRWYVLVAGEYATLTAANQALKGLPAELRRNGPWVRSLRQVQAELK